MTVPDDNQMTGTKSLLVTNKLNLLRRLSTTSLAAMLVTAFVIVFMYQQDEAIEHNIIATQDNEELAIHLMHLLDKQIYSLVSSSEGLDAQALRTNPNVDAFTAELQRVIEPNILKVKVYNLSGGVIYSSARGEIGGANKHSDWLKVALRAEVESHTEFRDTFLAAAGEMHDVNVSVIHIPLTHAGKRIGVFEIYADANPIFNRIHDNNIRIALIVFCAFTALYAALFWSALKADRAVSEWQKHVTELNEKVHKMAFYDALTQLPNRHLLKDRLSQTLAASKRSGRYGALIFLDMDNFKPLNDEHGHVAGDLLLVEGANRISSCVREMDTVARFGGDEFVVVLSELDMDKAGSIAQAGIVAEKIRAALAEPYVLKVRQPCGTENTIEHRCTSSIGVVLFKNHEGHADDILKWADMAMYQAKEAGRNSIRFYESAA